MMQSYIGLVTKQTTKTRPQQGERLLRLRQEAGLSQTELARLIEEPQQNIAYWERSGKPPRSDALPKLAKIFGVTVDYILTGDEKAPKKNGPTGRLQLLFEQASKLPRRQQEKIMEFLTAFVSMYQGRGQSEA